MDINLIEKLLELPSEVNSVDTKAKRYIKEPDISMLKEGQLEAFTKMREFVNTVGGGMFLLKGYAGTGKSYVVSKFVEWALCVKKPRTGMTAPTNKAVKVLKKIAEYQDVNLQYATIHSMLGLIEKVNGYGKQYFARDNRKESFPIDELDLVIVDEVSMLNDELFMYLLNHTQAGLKIIFVGDPAQIPPVGKEDCIPFKEDCQEEYGIQVVELTEIVRQSKDNPIIKETMMLREGIDRNTELSGDNDYDPNTLDGIFYLDKGDKKSLYKLLNRYFNSDHFSKDADFAKVIAWTNRTVDAFNEIIRVMRYGREVSKLTLGEKLVANSPIFDEEGNLSLIHI